MTLSFLDKIVILNNKIVNNKVFVKFEKGTKGWINIDDISFFHNDFTECNTLEDIKLSIPKNLKYKITKNVINDFKIANLIYENKLINDSFKIIISKFKKNIKDLIKSSRENDRILGNDKEYIFSGKLLNFNGSTIYYKSGYNASEGNKYFKLFMAFLKKLLISKGKK